MDEITIDLRPKVKPHKTYGNREVLRHVYYRITVPHYCEALNTFDKLKIQSAEIFTHAYDNEIVAMLKADGWTIINEKADGNYEDSCPQAIKGNQYLYCHPQSISGNIAPDHIGHMEQLFATAKTFKHYRTDNYNDVIIVKSTDEAKQVYHEQYDDKIDEIICKAATTKRRNLYHNRYDVVDSVCSKIRLALAIDNSADGNTDWGLADYVNECINRLIQVGWIRVGSINTGLVRTANKTEQKKYKLAL